jgi:hypothetical protein
LEKDAIGSLRAEEHRYKPNLASRLPYRKHGSEGGGRNGVERQPR